MSQPTDIPSEALSFIEWWMLIHRERRHLGSTLDTALTQMSAWMRNVGIPLREEGSQGVYADQVEEQPT